MHRGPAIAFLVASCSLLNVTAFTGVATGLSCDLLHRGRKCMFSLRENRAFARTGIARLIAQEKGQNGGEKKTVVDEIANKGIWQFGVTKEAEDALAAVGWVNKDDEIKDKIPVSMIQREDIEGLVKRAVDAEIFADERSKQMFIEETREQLLKEVVRREVREDLGCELEDLLNPIKVVSLETKILKAEKEMANEQDDEKRQKLQSEIDENRIMLATEKRAIMKDWLKTLFRFVRLRPYDWNVFALDPEGWMRTMLGRGQAVLSILVGGYLANNMDVPIAFRALGFWTIWLFTIPSLRAVKPLGFESLGISALVEKKALNLSFVLTPLLTLLLPTFTKDTGLIFWADLATVALCYGAYYAKGDSGDGDQGVEIKGVLRYLDYGTGRERGARK